MPKNRSDNNKPIWVKALLDRSLSPAAYRVFAYLYWRQGSNGSSWPSQNMIAEDLQLTRQGIKNITKRLEETGYIRIKRPKIQGRGQTLRYAISGQQKGATGVHPLSEKKGATGIHPFEAKRGNGEAQKGATEKTTNTKREHKEVEGGKTTQKTCVVKSLLPEPKTQELPSAKSTKRKVFIPPTSEQVREYAQSIVYLSLSAEHFCDWYESKGWMIGKNKMKDWQAAVRTWRRRDEADGKQMGGPKRGDPGWLPTEDEADEILRESGCIDE